MTNAEKTLERIATAADMLLELAEQSEILKEVYSSAHSRAEAYRFAANWIKQILGDK